MVELSSHFDGVSRLFRHTFASLKAEINTLRDVKSVSSLMNNGLHKW